MRSTCEPIGRSGIGVALAAATILNMLRISRETASEGKANVILKLDGQVSGPWVNELRRVCAEAMGNGPTPNLLVIDLADVMFIDATGVELFRELAAREVSIANPSVFVAEQLKEVPHAHD